MAGNALGVATRGQGLVIPYTAAATITYLEVLEFANSIGIALAAAVSGDVISVDMGGAVEYDLPKETGVVIAVGDQVYWDATNDNVDKTITNIPCGLATEAALSGDTSVRVMLNQGSGDA